MKKKVFALLLVVLTFVSSVGFAGTVKLPQNKVVGFKDTWDTPSSAKNDGEDRFYITLDQGSSVGVRPNYSVFGGRMRRDGTEVVVSHYETIDRIGKHNFGYITNMNQGNEVFLRYKLDDTSPDPTMYVWGRCTV